MNEITSEALGLKDRCFIIGEVAQAHDGSLGTAHAYIDALADAGADAVKFQTHIAAAESSRDEPWRVKFSKQDDSRYDYWKRMEFTESQWRGLADHAGEKGLVFMSSPFSVAAVELLADLDMGLWKIASGELYNPELLEAVWQTGKPVLYSSGMSTVEELTGITNKTRELGIPFGLFQCSSCYPCEPEMWGLAAIDQLRESFLCPVGLSDHSGTIYAGLAAAARGARLLEVHATFSREMFGPDVPASITIEEFASLVQGVRMVEAALQPGIDKDSITEKTAGLKAIFGRSWALKEGLEQGTVLSEEHLTLKKPAGGIPYEQRDELLGKRLKHDKPFDRILSWDDFE